MKQKLYLLPKNYKSELKYFYQDRHVKFVPDCDRNVSFDTNGEIVRNENGYIIYTDEHGHRFTMKNRFDRDYLQPETMLNKIFWTSACIVALPFYAIGAFFEIRKKNRKEADKQNH